MSILGKRKFLRVIVVMAAMPLLVAARVDRDSATKNSLRPELSSSIAADVHKKIALNYWKDADRLGAEAKDFTALGEARRKVVLIYEQREPTSDLNARMDYALADRYQKMALEARDLAEINEEMARSLSKEARPAKSAPQQSTPTVPCAGEAFID